MGPLPPSWLKAQPGSPAPKETEKGSLLLVLWPGPLPVLTAHSQVHQGSKTFLSTAPGPVRESGVEEEGPRGRLQR